MKHPVVSSYQTSKNIWKMEWYLFHKFRVCILIYSYLDTNECDPASDYYRGCAENAYCLNTVGLYECICNPGYEGDPNNYGCYESELDDPVTF